MLNISFYLREPQAERVTPIIMRLVLQGEKLKYSTKEKIHPLQWDADKQRAKTSRANIHSLELNIYLDNLYKMAVNAYRDHILEGRPPTLQDIKLAMDRRMNRVSEVKSICLDFSRT